MKENQINAPHEFQAWMFWLAPSAGAAIAGIAHRFLAEEREPLDAAYFKTVTP